MPSPLLRAVLAGSRLPDAGAKAARAVLNGFWLGVLSDRRLRELDELYYEREGVYRTADWNERGLFGWERDTVDRHFQGGERVAVLACGGGREVLALRQAGFDAVGYEPHPQLAAFARELLARHGHADAVHPVTRDAFPSGGRWDAVLVGWGGYSLVHGRARRVALLESARRALPPGGPVVVSYFERPVHDRELRLTLSLANALRRGSPLELGDTLAPNRVHVFTRAELADEASAAGLRLDEHRIFARPEARTDYAVAVLRAP